MLEEPGQLDSPSNEKGAQEPEKEEVPDEWSNLSGKAQDRFKQIMRQKNEALSERETLTQERERLQRELEELRSARPAPMPQSGDLSPEEQAAIARLKQIGAFATKEEIDAKVKEVTERVQAERDRELLDRTHENLEGKYSGSDNLPAYDRQEIEEYMRKNGIYNPEAAYRDKYFDEILEAKQTKQTKKEPYTERTKSRIPGGTPWSPETLAERLNKPDGRAFYQKNREKINMLYDQWRNDGA